MNQNTQNIYPQDEFKPFTIEGEYVFTPQCPLPGTALTCLNGLKHGATSRELFIPGEQPQDFYNLLAESFETHTPSTTEDAAIVTDAVLARWHLWRRQRAHYKREFEIFEKEPQENSPQLAGLKELELFDRYCTTAERKLNRALVNLHRVKKSALDHEKWQAQHALQKQRFDLDRERFEFRKEQDARVAPKIQAESELAAMHANKVIAGLKELESLERDKEGPIIVEDGEPVIIQHYFAFEKDGAPLPYAHPPNEEVEAIIAQRDQYVAPPQKVVRRYHFLQHGRFHPAFRSVVASIDRTNSVTTPEPNNGYGIRCSLSFDEWRQIIKKDLKQRQAA